MVLSLTTRRIRLTNFQIDLDKAFSKLKRDNVLSLDEKEFMSLVMDVKANNTIGFAIRSVMSDFTIDGFRDLYKTLISQGDDNARMMREILGDKCFKALQKLRS